MLCLGGANGCVRDLLFNEKKQLKGGIMGVQNKKNRAWARKEQAQGITDRLVTRLMIKQLRYNERQPADLFYPEKLGLIRLQESRDKISVKDYILQKGGL